MTDTPTIRPADQLAHIRDQLHALRAEARFFRRRSGILL
jgi:hypothetical protein